MKANIEQVAKIFLFSNLKPEILSELSKSSNLKLYKKGEIIIHEGELFLPKLYTIIDGSLLVQKIAISGKETNLRKLSAGEMFAAPALFGDRIAPATVIALEDSKIVTIDKSRLLKIIQISPEIAFNILQCFNQRLKKCTKQFMV